MIMSNNDRKLPLNYGNLETYHENMVDYINNTVVSTLESKIAGKLDSTSSLNADNLRSGNINVVSTTADKLRLDSINSYLDVSSVRGTYTIDADKAEVVRLAIDADTELKIQSTHNVARTLKIIIKHPADVNITWSGSDFLWGPEGDSSLTEPDDGLATDTVNAVTLTGDIWYMSVIKNFK